MRAALPILLFSILLLSSCANIDPGISEQDAMIIAKNVMAGQTKFFVKVGNETKTVTNINITSATAAYDGAQWNVALHVQGTDQDNMVRQNDVMVVLSRQGEVIGVGTGKVSQGRT